MLRNERGAFISLGIMCLEMFVVMNVGIFCTNPLCCLGGGGGKFIAMHS